ncbi:hypothetical protein Lbir_2798 [Legionella birminghamensis]|uniref:Uncharacterized protein n=1 Tax=Legionella birminghamensis TaxID=28083 RepID=A0A378IFV5_9GAMM|nr:hypothetical protein [Legionella birminghamensis]KTC68196.1 hypothetical protein Lbir_2798 [Legionella birminghamensis]STX31094.1 Uncharacterised protein [Legionella birminghamensis]
MDKNMQDQQQGQNKNLGSKNMQNDQQNKQKFGQNKQQDELQKSRKENEEIGKKPHQPL